MSRYGNIVSGLDAKGRLARYWNIVVFIRWTVVALIIVCMRDYGNLQTVTLQYVSLAMQVMIV